MKPIKKLIPSAIAATALLIIAGCALFGANPKPPTKFEQAIYDVVTNVVQHVVTVTNVETKVVVINHTNEVGTVVTQTNIVVIPVTVEKTNYTEAYTLTPKSEVAETAQTAGSVSNMILPGSGGLVTGIISGLALMWGKLRSSKKTGSALTQEMESVREFIKTLPNGIQYDQAIVKFLEDHQKETGTINSVMDLLQKVTSNKDARAAATEIKSLIESLKPSVP